MSIATLTVKGQITLPKNIRQAIGLEAGEKVDFRLNEREGTVTMVPLNKKVDDIF
jgi:antitoxin PrlF